MPCVGRKLNVLSFGEGDDDEDTGGDQGGFAAENANLRFRSAHETLGEEGRLLAAEAGVHDEHVAGMRARHARLQVWANWEPFIVVLVWYVHVQCSCADAAHCAPQPHVSQQCVWLPMCEPHAIAVVVVLQPVRRNCVSAG